MSLWERYAGWVVRRPALAVALALVGSAGLGLFLKDARIDNSIRALLPEGDPDIEYYLDVLERFGGAEVLVAAVPCGGSADCFTPEALTQLDRVTRAVQALSTEGGVEIRHVVSITSVVGVSGSGDTLRVGRLLPAVPGTAAEREELKRRVLSDRLYVRNLISPDGRVAAVMAYLDEMPGEERERVELVRAFRRAVRGAAGPDVPLHYSGVSVFTTNLYDDVYHDLKLFPLVTVLLVFAVLFWIFRSIGGVLIPHMVIGLSLCWTFGLFFLLGRPVTLVSVMLPSLLTVIAMSVVIHQLTHHLEETGAGHDRREAVRRTVTVIGPPCLLTSLTTMIGFASLGVADLRPVRDFGFFAAFGVLAAFLVAFLVVPPLLLYARPGQRLRQLFEEGPLTRLLVRVARATAARPRAVALAGLGVAILAAAGIPSLKVETNVNRFLDPDSPARQDLDFFERHLAGTSIIDVVLEGQRDGAIKDSRVLSAMAELQNWLETDPRVHKTLSAADYLRSLNRALNSDDPAEDRVPVEPDAAAQLFLLLEGAGDGELLARLVDDEYRTARLFCRVPMLPTSEQLDLLGKLEARVEALFPEELVETRVTGGVALYARTVDRLVTSQLLSFGVAFGLIALLLVVLFRSLRSGLIAMIPNLFPIVITLGAMGWFDISLNMATTMIASVSLGIAVDDTIHYLMRVRVERRGSPAWEPALERATRFTGRALVSTTLVIAGGFWILLFSSFQVTRYFGILAGLAVISALAADLVLTPACLLVFRPGLGLKRDTEEDRAA